LKLGADQKDYEHFGQYLSVCPGTS
jgi:hypothetical protein